MVLCRRGGAGLRLSAVPGAKSVAGGSFCYAGLILCKESEQHDVRRSSKDYGSPEWSIAGGGSDFVDGCRWQALGSDGETGDLVVPVWREREEAFL
jgi:hypothetical protein